MEHNRFCVSLRTALCFFIIESLASVAFGQALCFTPLSIGELRVMKSKLCVDIEGSDGIGQVQTSSCDGLDDQQMIICADGTIRNEQLNYCLQVEGSGNVVSAPCSLLNEIPARQSWWEGGSKTFTDSGGIIQVAAQIINMESKKCLDVNGVHGTGNIGVHKCEDSDDQYFYIRSRGRELSFGRLRNEASNLCLDVAGTNGKGDVGISACEDTTDQWFRFYENGELVNEESKWCVDVVDLAGVGNVLMHACEEQLDQMWTTPPAYCNGDSCSFMNKRSGNCLDVTGLTGVGNVGAHRCEVLADQRFTWVAERWVTPTATWSNVGCNQNGKVTQRIINSVTFGSSITSTTSLEISSTIGAKVHFLNFGVSTKVSASLAAAWTNSRTSSTAITFVCENYDSGESFTGGCMWQLQVDTTQVSSGRDLTWKPQIVKCTRTNTAPVCPPFTKCVNEDCTECKYL